MTYEHIIMQMIPGDTPREKREHMEKVKEFLEDLCYPKRGSDAEAWTISDIQKTAEPLMFLGDE